MITTEFIKIANIPINKKNSWKKYIKTFVVIGSRYSDEIKIIDPITFEIFRTYTFKDYHGGYISAEIMGKINYQQSYQFA